MPYQLAAAHEALGNTLVGLTGNLAQGRKHYERAVQWRKREGRADAALPEWWPDGDFESLR